MSLTTTKKLHNGVEIPAVGLGVYKMEDGTDVYQSVLSALEIGYRHIDTASFYQNEEGVGKAIKDSGIPREEIFVTTKVWNDEQGYENTKNAFQASLDRLGLEYVDLYLVHWPVPGKYKETWKALEEFYKEGRAKAIGVSNFLPHHLEDLMEDAEITPMANQIELHPRLTQVETREFCDKHNIVVEAWSPIAKARYLDDPVLQELASKHNKTAAQIIIRWDYQSGIVTIPKSVKASRQKENADIFDFELSEEDMKKIDAMDREERTGPHPDEFSY
ncbi:aldo/keto reductase [Aquibacillus albus]|uniref:Diketogulonate reductase-like aldo/keto reductase n=1 Tax=Aquibacillus albus TaxID=1168171 RepID=A0ABS2N135_9BACI|nr:aldo/keto reductase [Aquibacillus albus]MBM7571620.1 diketogulonate reductase-like aldo/keto reductase [Aquibacillus albus]